MNTDTQTYNGLTSAEVLKLREQYGYNELPRRADSYLRRIARRLFNPIALMIEIALVLSYIAGKPEDTIIIALLLAVNIGVEWWQSHRASRALEALTETLTPQAYVMRDGQERTIPACELVPGDTVILSQGDIVPADAEIIHSDDAELDQSAITGESLAVHKRVGDEVYASSIVQSGRATARVTHIGSETFVGRSATLVARAESEEVSHFQREVVRIGSFLTVVSVALVVLVSVVLWRQQWSIPEIVQFALVLVVASIPVALPAVLSVMMALGAATLSKHRAVVRNFTALEELAGVDTCATDKTGTLTENKLSVVGVHAGEQYDERTVLSYAILAAERTHRNALISAIADAAVKRGLNLTELDARARGEFVPFTSERKYSSARITLDDGTHVRVILGAPQVIEQMLTDDTQRALAHERAQSSAERGERTVAVALKTDGAMHYVGTIAVMDPPRASSARVVRALKRIGIRMIMITGDHHAIARTVGSVLGIGRRVVYGEALHREELYRRARIFAEVMPEDKYRIVGTLQRAGKRVAMTGDGVNDAPALRKADVGIAVSGATDAAREASDIVLLDKGLDVIRLAIVEARKTFARMQGYTLFRIAETIRVMLFVSLTVALFGDTPLTAPMIVMLALLNDVPVLAMAYDNARTSDTPMRWDTRRTLIISSTLGALGLLSSFTLLVILKWAQVPMAIIATVLFVKLDVAGHSTLYTTRAGARHFWQRPYPAWRFFIPAFGSRLVGTLVALLGILMTPIGIGAVLAIWIYSTLWFLLNDVIKVWLYRHL